MKINILTPTKRLLVVGIMVLLSVHNAFAKNKPVIEDDPAIQKIFAALLSPAAIERSWQFFYGDNAEKEVTTNNQRSLNEVLNPDGTIKTGINGSFNAEGFSMGYDKNGKPVFSPASVNNTGDNAWDNKASQLITGTVNAVAISNDTIYVGTSANIYQWDGSSWSVLGGGVNGAVRVIAISGTDVYVGGGFTQAGGDASIQYIAKWDGSSWSALGAGVNGTVYAIAVSGTDVYVGGSFTQAGGHAANRIALWNGSSWSALGSGVNNYSH
ncbi:MAG: hypothetical protein KF781_08355 [Chitinophagaceae bacterium]|nr:hypothetical protein [Chitinophagaceae bacterium]MCW5905768.1 hypothetical protein [Chitinophagaceae bacterium]